MATLIELYNSISSDSSEFWSNSNGWDGTASGDPCDWKSGSTSLVACDASGHVIRLNFNDKGIAGTLPDLSPLTSLRGVDFGFNALTGKIPALPASLTQFDAGINQLTGSIPALPASLEEFYVDNNQLTDSIPALPASLKYFYAGNNQLTGTIPALPASLRWFGVGTNQLTGLPPAPPNNLTAAYLCPNNFEPRTGTPEREARAAQWDAAHPGVWTDDCSQVYTVTGAPSPAEGGTFTCSPATVGHTGSATCTAAPAAGYELSGTPSASGGASVACSGNTCTVDNITSDETITATFTASSTGGDTGGSTGGDTGGAGGDTGGSGDGAGSGGYHSSSSPTLGELGLLLSGIALAGAAAPALRRRERKERRQD